MRVNVQQIHSTHDQSIERQIINNKQAINMQLKKKKAEFLAEINFQGNENKFAGC
jgi:hypothetical protein